MRIFLTGATGYIGSAVLEAFARQGHAVTGLVRDSRRAQFIQTRGAGAVVGDLGNPSSWAGAAASHDAFVHTAFDGHARGVEIDRAAIAALVEAARGGDAPRPVVYTSGVWVLGPTRQPAAEDAPLNPIAKVVWRPAHEQAVLAAEGIRPVVVRPGVVYGGHQGILGDLFKDGTNGLIRIVGDGRNHWPLVYDHDLADLYVRLVTNPEASGVYHANDEGDETVLDIVEAIARVTTHRPDVRHVPIEEARAKMGGHADALALDQVVRSPRARALGWAPSLRSVSGNIARLLEEWRVGRGAETF